MLSTPAPDPHYRREFFDPFLAAAKRGDAEHNRRATERERADWPAWMRRLDLEIGMILRPWDGGTSTRSWPRWARSVWAATSTL